MLNSGTWARFLLFAIVLLFSGCGFVLPEPDCGGLLNVKIVGVVTDESSNPIPGATIHLESQKTNACTGSTPIPDITLVTDELGSFSHTIPLIFADDVIRIEVSAEGFQTHSYDERTYTFFDQELAIVLSPVELSSP